MEKNNNFYYHTITGSRYWKINIDTSDFDDYYIGDIQKKNFIQKQKNFSSPYHYHFIKDNLDIGIQHLCNKNLRNIHELCVLFPDENLSNNLFYSWIINHNEQIIIASKKRIWNRLNYLLYRESLIKINISNKEYGYKILVFDLLYAYAQLGDYHFKDAINSVRNNADFYKNIRLGKYSQEELKQISQEKYTLLNSVANFYDYFDEDYLRECEEELKQLAISSKI